MNDFFINKPSKEIPEGLTNNILKESRPLEYHSSLPEYKPTPLVHFPLLANKYKVGNIYIKNEAFRFGLNAFKGLGASYAIHKLIEKGNAADTFCTATDGNHGRAVAWASRLSGKKAVIFVPKDTTENRIRAIENEGATVIKTDQNYDETCRISESVSEKEGWQLVQDTAWDGYEEIPAQIMAGYLTLCKELEESIHGPTDPKINIVFLQAGVGSFAAAVTWYYLNRYGNKMPKIVLVEPYEADGFLESFKQGKRSTPNGNYQTIMAGLNCGLPSSTAWDILKNGIDATIRIKDKYAERAIRQLYYPEGNDPSVIAGESGVGGLAGFIALMTNDNLNELKTHLQISERSNILFISTEGATDPDVFKKIIEQK